MDYPRLKGLPHVPHTWDNMHGKSGQDFPFSILSAMQLHPSWLKHALWVQGKGFPCVAPHTTHWGWGHKNTGKITVLVKSVAWLGVFACPHIPQFCKALAMCTQKSLGLCTAEVICPQSKWEPSSEKKTKKPQKTEQGKEKGFKCMEKWMTYFSSPDSGSVQSEPPDLPHRYKGITCSSAQQQPKFCLELDLSMTPLDQSATNIITQLCPKKQVSDKKLYSLAKHQGTLATHFTICFSIAAILSSALALFGVRLPPPHPLVIGLLLYGLTSMIALHIATPRTVWSIKSTYLMPCSPLAC